MKTLSISITAMLLFFACKKEEKLRLLIFDKGPQDTGFCSAKRDGDTWDSTAKAFYYPSGKSLISIDVLTFTSDGSLREAIGFYEIPLMKGAYPIKGTTWDINDGFVGAGYGVLEEDGDVVGASYEPIDGGELELTKVDTTNHEI